MRFIEFEKQNQIIAKDQPQYMPLPAYVQKNGIITCCAEITLEESVFIRKNKRVTLAFAHFERPPQPVRLHVVEPDWPVSYQDHFNCHPIRWVDQVFIMAFPFVDIQLKTVLKNRQFWLSIATFGSPLQPISSTICF